MDKSVTILHLAGIATVTALVFALIVLVQYEVMYSYVVPYAGTPLDIWVDDFVISAQWGAGITAALVVIWYVLGQWVLKVTSWENGGKRVLWALFGIAAIAVSLGIGLYMTERTQGGGELAWFFYLLNPILLYYLATLFFSPTAYKYTAPLAVYIRRWR